MDETRLTAHVIERLSATEDRDDLILDVCERAGWTWPRAAEFVDRIEAENRHLVARRQFPLLFVLALILFLGGAGMIVYGVYGFYLAFTGRGGAPADLTTYFMPVIETGSDPIEAMRPAISPYVQFLLYSLFGPIPALFVGASMALGSLLGMKKVWSAVLFKEQ